MSNKRIVERIVVCDHCKKEIDSGSPTWVNIEADNFFSGIRIGVGEVSKIGCRADFCSPACCMAFLEELDESNPKCVKLERKANGTLG